MKIISEETIENNTSHTWVKVVRRGVRYSVFSAWRAAIEGKLVNPQFYDLKTWDFDSEEKATEAVQTYKRTGSWGHMPPATRNPSGVIDWKQSW